MDDYYQRVRDRISKEIDLTESEATAFLEECLGEIFEMWKNIEMSVVNKEIQKTETLLHQFIGATGNLRMVEVSELSKLLELDYKTGDHSMVIKRYEELHSTMIQLENSLI